VSSIRNSGLRDVENIQWKNRLHAHKLQPDTPIIQLLIHGGASLRAKNENGLTPLLHALQKGKKNVRNIKTIASYSSQEEINEVDNKGCNALHHIAKMKNAKPAFREEITNVRLAQNISSFCFLYFHISS
jgi:ankyrin repeat protein